jgi:myo-inositol-1(or 4)-monophosphatase
VDEPDATAPARTSEADGRALLSLAVAAARSAGALLLARFGGPAQGVGTKSSATDMVSDADREAERLIRDAILSARPRDALVGEEGAAARGGSGVRWLVDPLDGTTNFLYGIPAFAVSIACADEGGALLGVVHDPCRDETFAATRGAGTRLNGEPARVSPCPQLAEALVATGFSYAPAERDRQARALTAILPRVRDIRRGGSAALDLAWVACGRLDGYFEGPLMPWDVDAGVLLVVEAGGRVARLSQGAQDGERVVASCAAIHEGLLELVRPGLEPVGRPGNRLHSS